MRGSTTFEDNVSTIAGGGIFNSAGQVTVVGTPGSTPADTIRVAFISNLTGGAGGGIYNSAGGSVAISTATFRGNQAGDILGGGAIFSAAGGTALSVGDTIFNSPPLNSPGNITGDFVDTGSNLF